MDLLVKAAAKALAFCFLAFLGILCITTGLSACTEAEFTWPTLTVTWNIDEKDGYLADSAVGPAIHQACSPEITIAGCCWNVDITNKKLFLDGVEDNGQVLNEGTHNAKLEFDASIYGTNPDATFHKVVTYTFPKPFTIDKTAPIINLTKPKNNASIPITDVSLTGSVSDADARLGIVDVSLSVSSPCRFLKDFSGATVNLGTISG
ncbi:MAG: hypothetical protein Q8O90_12230, partial [Elusimicrobiota bacterium]|nr:hypothetical protein [Elusimicrobiota bacterium]